jgi:hypothetical protein
MAVQYSSSYNAKLPSGLALGMPAERLSAPVAIAPLTLESLQQGLGSRLLNASRTSIDQFRLAGIKNDQPVLLVGHHKLPKTGLDSLDNAIEKVIGVAGYVPQATQDALTNALRWGLAVGCSVSAATAAGFILLAGKQIEEKTVPGFRRVVTVGYGAMAGLAIGLGGFIYSLLQNLRDVHLHLTKDPSVFKPKKGS